MLVSGFCLELLRTFQSSRLSYVFFNQNWVLGGSAGCNFHRDSPRSRALSKGFAQCSDVARTAQYDMSWVPRGVSLLIFGAVVLVSGCCFLPVFP